MQVTMSNILQLLEESFCTFSNEGVGCDANYSIGSGSSYDVDDDDEDSDDDIDTTKMLGMASRSHLPVAPSSIKECSAQ